MRFDPALQPGRLLRRYKRFLADIEMADGHRLTIHCPNTGSMLNCSEPGSRVWYSTSSNPNRKYRHTWEMVECGGEHLVGINTGRANALVEEALVEGTIIELDAYRRFRREVAFGDERSRIDFLLGQEEESGRPLCYLEVKNLTLNLGDGLGVFPDAVTARGQKHLRELISMKSRGHRAVLLFCVQHAGVDRVAPADRIDPEYGVLLRKAAALGVEVMAYRTTLGPEEFRLLQRLPVNLE
jgi:sugar fermentation stimulation protein A